jgi:cytochrome c oxidase accessory protein FixG
VLYDEKRGEPRRGRQQDGVKQGDCVDCFRCVAVCPVGIDIRRGQQLECIGCTACIDACDEIMDKVKKPRGLIRYGRGDESVPARWWRPATILYTAILTVLLIGVVVTVIRHEPVSAEVLRAKGDTYSDGGGGLIVNHFRLEVSNSLLETVVVRLSTQESSFEIVSAQKLFRIKGGEESRIDFFVKVPVEKLQLGRAHGELTISAATADRTYFITKELPLVGPIQKPSSP